MQSLKSIVGGLFVAIAIAGTSFADCRNTTLRLQEEGNGEYAGKEITLLLACHEGSHEIPSTSTIQVLFWQHGQLCHAHRTCGNLTEWQGSIGVGASWYWGDSIADIVQSFQLSDVIYAASPQEDHEFSPVTGTASGSIRTQGRELAEFDETGIHLNVSLEIGTIKRYCEAAQQAQCLDM